VVASLERVLVGDDRFPVHGIGATTSRFMRRLRRAGLQALLSLGALGPAALGSASCGSPTSRDVTAVAPASSAATAPAAPSMARRARVAIDGRAFPDHLLALTWDDGPDANTLRLAGYLASRRVSGTFFVVGEWASALSEEPGQGPLEFETGYAYLPILGDLVALGHRLGNHTANHVVLAGAKPELVDFELRENQKNIDPFLTNELRIFRSPGGAWDEDAGTVVDRVVELDGIVGPVCWDVDAKDWEGSLYCRSERPAVECEPAAPGRRSRVRVDVIANRYVANIAEVGHGIVLFHDRVGDVGSDYAVRLARRIIPELESRGFVFGAPVLEFGPFRARAADALTADWLASLDEATVTFFDADGDGRADVCGHGTGGFGCARSTVRTAGPGDARPFTVFEWRASWSPSSGGERRTTGSLHGDLNGDGREDVCTVEPGGIACAMAAPQGSLDASTWLAASREDAKPWLGADARLALADINGDGRADLCSLRAGALGCALAP